MNIYLSKFCSFYKISLYDMTHKIAWRNVNQWPFYGIHFYKLCLKSVSSLGYDKQK